MRQIVGRVHFGHLLQRRRDPPGAENAVAVPVQILLFVPGRNGPAPDFLLSLTAMPRRAATPLGKNLPKHSGFQWSERLRIWKRTPQSGLEAGMLISGLWEMV